MNNVEQLLPLVINYLLFLFPANDLALMAALVGCDLVEMESWVPS